MCLRRDFISGRCQIRFRWKIQVASFQQEELGTTSVTTGEIGRYDYTHMILIHMLSESLVIIASPNHANSPQIGGQVLYLGTGGTVPHSEHTSHENND
jgi:hypothetical protein